MRDRGRIDGRYLSVGKALGAAALLAAGCSGAPWPEGYTPRPANTLTFNRDVAPVVLEKCAVCHRPDAAGPFSLVSYKDVRKRKEQIADVVRDRFMPPWLPEPGPVKFKGERLLSVDEIGGLIQWVREGAREGNPADLPPRPGWPQGWQSGEPDLVVRMPEPYTLPAGGDNVFRSFVFPLRLGGTRYVKAVELRPGNPKIVRHVRMEIDQTGLSRQFDQDDPEPGFEGMLVGSRSPAGYLLGWAPGETLRTAPEGTSWRLDEGGDLVLFMHLLPGGQPESIQPSIGFFFADQPPQETLFTIRLGLLTIDIPPGDPSYAIEDSYLLPVAVEVMAVYPHAHSLGREMQGFATLPDGTRKQLIRIDHWDVNWQEEYRYAEPIPLPRGTTLSMHFTYDNSGENPRHSRHPPVRVTYGGGAANEMGDLLIQVLPRTPEDAETLARDFIPRERQARIDGYEKILAIDPDQPGMQYALAFEYQQFGLLDRSAEHFREALRLKPDDAGAHYELGLTLQLRHQYDEALEQYRQAIRITPELAEAHSHSGYILLLQGRVDEAVREYGEALRLTPDDPETFNNLGQALQSQGHLEEAVARYQEALKMAPGFAEARSNLGNALLALGRPDEAAAQYRMALEANPNYAAGHYNLGVVLQSQGRLEDAIGQYRQALALDPDDAPAHTNLGNALAATGHLDEAVRHFRRALQFQPDLAEVHNSLGLVFQFEGRLDDAIREYRRALQLRPDLHEAQENLRKALSGNSS